MPQDRLGWAIGLDEHTASARMSRYETGVHEPPYSLVKRLAEALLVPVAYFYADDDELAELIVRWGELGQVERAHLMNLVHKVTSTGSSSLMPTEGSETPQSSTR